MKVFLAIFVSSWICALLLPWWALLIPAFIFGAWLSDGNISAFTAGFFGAGLGWFVQAFYVHVANDAILSTRIADMVGAGSPFVVLFATFLIAAIPGGLGALAGFQVKSILKPESQTASV